MMPPATLKDVHQIKIGEIYWIDYDELVLILKEWEEYYDKLSNEGRIGDRPVRQAIAGFINMFTNNGKGKTTTTKAD